MVVPVFETEAYKDTVDKWPAAGKHILAQYTDDAILVYQAFKPSITEYAIKHGHFGGPDYNTKRMTWIKTSFLWMMFRSNWGSKKSQDTVVGIWIKRSSFERILEKAVRKQLSREKGKAPKNKAKQPTQEEDDVIDDEASGDSEEEEDNRVEKKDEEGAHPERFVVRLQWDPDHYPDGSRHYRRRAIQLGVRGWSGFVSGDDIVAVEDISEFVAQQRNNSKKPDVLQVPKERVYKLQNPDLARLVDLDN